MKYNHELKYAYGKDIVKGGVEIYEIKPVDPEAHNYEDLIHFKYAFNDPFHDGEKIYSWRIKEFKWARIEGIAQLDNLWDMLERGIKEDDEEYVEWKKYVTRCIR